LLVNEKDAGDLGVCQGKEAWVSTGAYWIRIPVEISDMPAQGTATILHGFGMLCNNEAYGVDVNELTPSGQRDRIAGTPLPRYIPCRARQV